MRKWKEDSSKLRLTEETLNTTYINVVTYICYGCLLSEYHAYHDDTNIDVWKVNLPEKEQTKKHIKKKICIQN